MKKIFYYSIMYASCAMLYVQILLFESFYKVLTSMNKILRIWRYVTIGFIVSLLTLSIFVLGCTTANPKEE